MSLHVSRWRGFAAMLIGLLAGACVAPSLEEGEVVPGEVYQIDEGTYRLQAGDRIVARFTYHPRRDQLLLVRPDGKVSMPFAEEVQLAGLTVPEASEVLSEAVSSELDHGEVIIQVEQAARQVVYVCGAVGRSRTVRLTRGMTALQAVIAAGNFSNAGARDWVLVLREASPTTRLAWKVDLSEEGMLRTDYELQPFDTIYVPRSSIARVAVWIDQHINNMLPRGVRILALNFTYRTGIIE